MKFTTLLSLILLILPIYCRAHYNNDNNLDDCIKQDSITCVQKSLYRRARDFFNKDSWELIPGISLVKRTTTSTRDGKSLDNIMGINELDNVNGVEEKQKALEKFVKEEVGGLLQSRSLKINFAPAFEKISQTARAFSESIPTEVRQAADEVVEGRGKKKLMKSLMPLLLAAKVKIGALATLGYFAIALLAKKAILASLISIAISAFLGLKSFWSGGSSKSVGYHHEGYNAGWSSGGGGGAGWSAPVSSSNGWDDAHGAYSAQSQAYSGYHH